MGFWILGANPGSDLRGGRDSHAHRKFRLWQQKSKAQKLVPRWSDRTRHTFSLLLALGASGAGLPPSANRWRDASKRLCCCCSASLETWAACACCRSSALALALAPAGNWVTVSCCEESGNSSTDEIYRAADSDGTSISTDKDTSTSSTTLSLFLPDDSPTVRSNVVMVSSQGIGMGSENALSKGGNGVSQVRKSAFLPQRYPETGE